MEKSAHTAIDYAKLDTLLESKKQRGAALHNVDCLIGEEFQLVILTNQIYAKYDKILHLLRLDTNWKSNEYFDPATNQFSHDAWFGLAFVDKLYQIPSHPTMPIKFHFDFERAMSDMDYRDRVVDVITGEETKKAIQNMFQVWIKIMNGYYEELLHSLKNPAKLLPAVTPQNPMETPEKYLFTGTKEITI